MRLPLRNLAAVALLLITCPGCNLEDTDGDGAISVDEFVASLQNGFCGGDDTTDDETTTPSADEPTDETTDPTTDFTSGTPSLDDLT